MCLLFVFLVLVVVAFAMVGFVSLLRCDAAGLCV